MKIIILGAGQVGGTLAEHLTKEQNDVTVVDINADKLRALQERLDLRTITGHASDPDTLYNAGAEDADMLIAVTNSDEINMVACQIAHSLFHTPTKISRVRSTAYLSHKDMFDLDHVPIDVLIGPEQLVTENIHELIANPGTLQVLSFADGQVQLVAVRAISGGPLVGHQLQDIREHMPEVDTRVAAIFRQGQPIIPRGTTVIEAGDEVFFIAARNDIRAVMSELRQIDRPEKHVIIAGGGNIGSRLAEAIEDEYHTKVIELSHSRCQVLSELLDHAIVLHGDISDKNLLDSANIENADVFCALTNSDEANIMVSMLAKRMGARKVITLITKPAYIDLLQGDEIDIALSPQQITISSLLAHVRRGDVHRVHSLRRGAAEAMETVVHGDAKSSKVIGRRLDEIKLPTGVTVGAIVRNDEVLIAHDHLTIKTNDHVILFMVDKKQVGAVERLFQVGLGFF